MKPLATLFALFAIATAAAHDLADNRATLVLRDRTHLSVSLYLNYSEALHQALLPQREYGAFLMMYSSMKPEDLKRELTRAQSKFEASLQISSAGARLKLTNWSWPDAQQVRTLLQHQMMQAMVDDHAHESPVEIKAEVVATREITSVVVQFPDEFRKVLVVSYKPNQVWVESKTASPEIRF